MTATDEYIEAYFMGDPTDAAGFTEFTERVDRARTVLGADIATYDRPVERIWAYGSGWGATHGYDAIEGDVRAQSAETARAVDALGADVLRIDRDIQRLWAYGDGDGATHGYDAINGDVRAPPRCNVDHAAGL
jgi:hypothetical protein